MKKPVRGRFDIVAPLQHGASVRFTSKADKSLTLEEIIEQLRKFIEQFGTGEAHDE